ncbi:phage major tail tube protein [Sphingomonas abaci]|uniref:Phage major tail tube protein n=1 Tax=Sphingomonas abaci TaxID=237611 RepID=A0A7W7AKP5_9SPHN|nr:phage major tail tube protein [Sphingomonas abaci]MBB4617999.1 hypothetical protein [Sphingomonas abaci]
MALPRKLKIMDVFNEGQSWMGQVSSVTLPKIAMKGEDWRGAGMIGEVTIDMGLEKLELETTCGGPMRDSIRQLGTPGVAGTFRRFAGGYQDDSTGEVTRVDITMRGRPVEIDKGEAKVGEGGEFKDKWALSYLREEWDGRVLVEIDLLNGVYIVDGVDRYAELRNAIL